MQNLLLIALASATALAAPAAMAQPISTTPSHSDFGPGDNGRKVRIYNPIFTVGLPANPSTGYSWRFEPDLSHNVNVLKQQTADAPHPPGMVGGGGMTYFTIRSTAMSGDLTLWLTPPGRSTAEKSFHLNFASGYSSGRGHVSE